MTMPPAKKSFHHKEERESDYQVPENIHDDRTFKRFREQM
jgi:hypothetical protein